MWEGKEEGWTAQKREELDGMGCNLLRADWVGSRRRHGCVLCSFVLSRLPARGPPVRGRGSACWVTGQYLSTYLGTCLKYNPCKIILDKVPARRRLVSFRYKDLDSKVKLSAGC